MSALIEINIDNLVGIKSFITKLQSVERQKVLKAIGVLVVSQVKNRIQNTKVAPDGTKWQPWSEKYAKTRHGGQSLLQNEGDLLQSIAFNINGNELEVGTDEIYSGSQQYGLPKKNVPARAYLGLSQEDIKEIEEELTALIGKVYV